MPRARHACRSSSSVRLSSPSCWMSWSSSCGKEGSWAAAGQAAEGALGQGWMGSP